MPATTDAQRCAYCHDRLDRSRLSTPCAACGTVLHDECWGLQNDCPTLGCRRAKPVTRTDLKNGPRRRPWLLIGAGGGVALSIGLAATLLLSGPTPVATATAAPGPVHDHGQAEPPKPAAPEAAPEPEKPAPPEQAKPAPPEQAKPAAVSTSSVPEPVWREGQNNPEFRHWARFRVGSWVRLLMHSDAGGNQMTMEFTYTLKEVTNTSVSVETKGFLTMGGNKIDIPASTREIAAKIANPGQESPRTDDVLELDGVSLACKVTEATSESSGMKTWSKVWMSSSIPGGVARLESKSEGTTNSKTSMQAVKWLAK